nr:MAG TPA: chromosome segregation protein [Caudoviricetes sp.]
MNNIITAVFTPGNAYTRLSGAWQYDYGQVLRIQGLQLPPAVEVHFSLTETGGEAVTRIGVTQDGVTDVPVPDSLLENANASHDYTIYAFLYLANGSAGNTEYKISLQVRSRPRPEVPGSPEEPELFREAVEAVNKAADRAETAAGEAAGSAVAADESATKAGEAADAAINTETRIKNLEQEIKKVGQGAEDAVKQQEIASKKAVTDHADAEIGRMQQAVKEADDGLKASIKDAGTAKDELGDSTEKAGAAKAALDKSIGDATTGKTALDKSIGEAGTAKTALDKSIEGATTGKTALDKTVSDARTLNTALETNLTEGRQLKTDLKATGDAAVKAIQDEAATQLDKVQHASDEIAADRAQIGQNKADIAALDTKLNANIAKLESIENALSNYFALRRNGKVFTTKIYKWETSTSPVGVKMNANENMVATPSVGRTEGRDDYAQYGLFHHFTCNFSVDESGFNHVDALEGQSGFTKYGKVQVGEVTMSAWFGIEDATEAVLYHYSDSQTELTPYPMKESINPDGTISPFMIHAKYAAGDIDGVPYSSKGLAPANGCQATQARNPVSYTGMITYMHKLGGHYCGTTSWDLFYRQLMMIIKYATTHSQSIMAGCTSYSNQNQNLVEETGVMRVVLTKAQAAGYVIGSYVSIGDVGSNTNKDRYYSYMHNKAYSVKVTKIEDVDDSNAAVYVDAPEAFDTTLTTWITTMPWHSGATDEVAGSDGSPNSNTNGKDPYKIQGIETCIGAYEVLGNVVMDIVTGADGNPARDVYVCEDASTLSSNIATVRANYKKAIAQVAYTAASWKYITEETTDPNLGIMIPTKAGGGSTTGFADGLYTDTGTSGQREWLALGNLYGGANAGLWFLYADYGWSSSNWYFVSGVSPNGTRGEWQATA